PPPYVITPTATPVNVPPPALNTVTGCDGGLAPPASAEKLVDACERLRNGVLSCGSMPNVTVMFWLPPFTLLTGTVAVYVPLSSAPVVASSVIVGPAIDAVSQPLAPAPYVIVPILTGPRLEKTPAPVFDAVTVF